MKEKMNRSTKYKDLNEEQEKIEEWENIESKEETEELEEVEEKKKHPKLKKFLVICSILITALFIYAFTIEPKLIIVKEHKITSEKIPISFDGLKIIHFSDIHYGNSITKKELNKIEKK